VYSNVCVIKFALLSQHHGQTLHDPSPSAAEQGAAEILVIARLHDGLNVI
jgi:hypothetical protein